MTCHIPKPGDLIVALKPMNAWASDSEQRPSPGSVRADDVCCVIGSRTVGKRHRLFVMVGDKFYVFSCKTENVRHNWKIVDVTT